MTNYTNKSKFKKFLYEGWFLGYRVHCKINDVEYSIEYDENFFLVFTNIEGQESFTFKSRNEAINFFF